VRLFAEPGNVTEGLTAAVEVHLLRDVFRLARDVDVYHVLAPLIPRHVYLMAGLETRGKPIVLSTMAQLMPHALKVKRLKKALYLCAASPWIGRAAFHAFGPAEASGLRARFPGRRIYQASLGVYPRPGGHSSGFPSPARAESDAGPLRLLFFGRNDRVQKGLDILLPAFLKTVIGGANVRLTIAGRPSGDSEPYISSFVTRHGLGGVVDLRGPVDDLARESLFAEADFLVYLSRWDGPPRPIREAIARGLPVVATPESNMGHLLDRFGAGLQVALDVDEVARSFHRLARTPRGGERFREGTGALARFLSWERLAGDYADMYEAVRAGT
jgi:glycosyltransferase involved in cell wall biosynthesis